MSRVYSVQQLSDLAGVSVRTLHHYDKLGLLTPMERTEARYRHYGEKELLRLQQILFYKELDFSLAEIKSILDDPDFDMLKALVHHKTALQQRKEKLNILLGTLDKTISKLKGEPIMISHEELYQGFTPEQALQYRKEAIEKYGQTTVESSEQQLYNMGKNGFEELKAESERIATALREHKHNHPGSDEVQQLIERHYNTICRFWGEDLCKKKDMKAAYRGLAQLYIDDLRYTSHNGQKDPEYAAFMQKAMNYYADKRMG